MTFLFYYYIFFPFERTLHIFPSTNVRFYVVNKSQPGSAPHADFMFLKETNCWLLGKTCLQLQGRNTTVYSDSMGNVF